MARHFTATDEARRHRPGERDLARSRSLPQPDALRDADGVAWGGDRPAAEEIIDTLDRPATPSRLRVALEAEGAPPAVLARALAIAGASPAGDAWRRFLWTALLLVGAALILAGVITFFAFNWHALGRMARFALIEGAIAACALAGWWRIRWITGQVALTAAAVLIGPLLAVYGQAYQTGADPWGLFAAWAALALPWTLAARFTPLWLIWLGVADVGLMLYVSQTPVAGGRNEVLAMVLAAGLHAVAVATWEWQRTRPVPWLTDAWGPRLAVAVGFISLVIASVVMIVAPASSVVLGPVAPAALAAGVALAFWFYRYRRFDLFVLTAALGSAMTAVTVFVGRVVFEALDLEVLGLLFMTVFVLVEIALAIRWLRTQAAEALP
ncbi:MAG TPA: DUF2157 domain-containing protein [Vicinamibacterales bacterium]